MGQYYKAVMIENVGFEHEERVKTITPAFMKLMGHAWFGIAEPTTAMIELLNKPHWVAWIGDYANDVYHKFPNPNKKRCLVHNKRAYMHYYRIAHKQTRNNRVPDLQLIHPDDWDDREYDLINHTKKIFVNMADYYKSNHTATGTIHPLPLLTALGNGEGGGDYFNPIGLNHIGDWAFDLLEVKKHEDNDTGYMSVLYYFKQN